MENDKQKDTHFGCFFVGIPDASMAEMNVLWVVR